MVDWVSSREDGHGYDIKSYFPDGTEKFIEVKGTKFKNKNCTFYLSERERLVAEEFGDKYVLVLVENVGDINKIEVGIELRNPLRKIQLKPLNYLGSVQL